MHGDFSRWTHHPRKHYSAVLEQQGRVRIDADANEQEAIDQHLRQTTARDVVGAVGAPFEGGGFRVTPSVAGDGNPQLTIAAGRLYVDGILCQLDELVLPIVEFLAGAKKVRVARLPSGDPRLAEGQAVEIIASGAASQPVHIRDLNPETRVITFDVAVALPAPGGVASVRTVTTFRTQPDYPLPDDNPWTLPDPEEVTARTDLVYLDVWQRHLTALEDPDVRDVALGGPDTTTRLQTICQVKVLPGVPSDTTCSDPLPDRILRPNPGRLTNQLEESAPSSSPCVVAPGGGFRGLENRLYRVEIHRPGRLAKAAPATFKWSRDNGAVVYRVTSFELTESSPTDTDSVQLEQLGRDRTLALKKGDWVELLDDWTELRGEPGLLVQVDDVKESQGRVLFAVAIDVSRFDLARHPKLRRWDGAAREDVTGNTSEGIPVADAEIELEDGISVRFADGEFRTGDYWFFAARTATHSIEPLDVAPPRGIRHDYARLAVLTWTLGEAGFEVADGDLCDCRPQFPSLTQQIRLAYVSGDGQEAMPGQQLCGPLAVRLTNGGAAVAGASVKFAVVDPPLGYDGQLITPETSDLEVTVTTDQQGLAQCNWQLGQSPDVVCQQVRATLLDCHGNERPQSLLFRAKLSIASEVANVTDCPVIAGDATVQDALNTLCANSALYYVGGDGQAAAGGAQLCGPLEVRVANGRHPVAGAKVLFEIQAGTNGRLARIGGAFGTNTLSVVTDHNGLAACRWQLDKQKRCQQVEARLDGAEALPIHFNAQRTEAADEPGIQIRQVILGATNQPLRNDASLRPDDLQKGILLQTLGPVDLPSVSRATTFVTVEVPRRFGDAQPATVAFIPHILAASTTVTPDVIAWFPSNPTIAFLNSLADQFNEPLLARITVQGNFIWNHDPEEGAERLYLDGDTFGDRATDGSTRPDGTLATHLIFPSGDGCRGGDFRMWFWLRRERIVVVPPDVLDFGNVLVGDDHAKIMHVEITNNGTSDYNATLNVSGNGFALAGVDNQITVEPRARKTIPLVFQPPKPEQHTGQLAIISSSPADPSFTLQLMGVGIVNVIAVDKPAVDFGKLTRTSRRRRTIVVSNQGDEALIVDAIESDVPGLTANPSSFQVAPGGQLKVTLSLQPRSAGAVSGEVRIVSGASRQRVTVSAIVRDSG